MADFKAVVRKMIINVTAATAGICIFAAIASVMLDNTLFNQTLHRSLFIKYGIYSQIGDITKKYFDDYSKNFGKESPESQKQQEELVSLADKALTPEMISLNTNSVIDGLILYFKNETRFLPDIYLKPAYEKTSPNQIDTSVIAGKPAANSLTGIDRINLSIVLMYLNRTDISDKIMVIKLFQFVLSKLSPISYILSAFCLLAGYLALGNNKTISIWLKKTILVAGSIFLISAIALFFCLYIFIPWSKEIKNSFALLPGMTMANYIKDWLSPLTLFLFAAGLIVISFIPIFKFSSKPVKSSRIYLNLINLKLEKEGKLQDCIRKKYYKVVICSFSLLIIILFSILQYQIIMNEFRSKDLAAALDRMKGVTSFSRVVYAQDAAIYALEIRIMDKKTGLPIEGIQMNISGKSINEEKTFDELKTSDSDGKVKAILDTGSYNLSFDYGEFPEEYIMPSPYYFKIETAGTTVLTINLDRTEPKNPGVLEIQILDKDNLPVTGLELALDDKGIPPKDTGKAYSFTNTEGVAAFRTKEGNYTITFQSSGFPPEYEIPKPIDTEVISDETIRYTLKLVLKDIQKNN